MNIGRMIFYDNVTGEIIVDTGEYANAVKKKSTDQLIQTYSILKERNRESFDYIELNYGDYHYDFMNMNGYRVNPETKELEFSYPDENSTIEEPVYQKPLSEKIKELEDRTSATEDALLTLLME